MSDAPRGEGPDLKAEIEPDPALVAAGWTPRFLADAARCAEAVELYSRIGFEVRIQPVAPADFDEKCGECPAVVCRTYSMIYTRRLGGPAHA